MVLSARRQGVSTLRIESTAPFWAGWSNNKTLFGDPNLNYPELFSDAVSPPVEVEVEVEVEDR